LATQSELRLRNFEWCDTMALAGLLADVGAHGHRQWPESVEGVRSDLEYPRVQPEQNLVMAEVAGELVGYAIVEPEQNIGRSVVGIAAAAEKNTETLVEALLGWATSRAAEFTPIAHLATRDHETDLGEYVERNGWARVRKYLQLESRPGDSRAAGVVPTGFTLKEMVGLDELPELTNLQNQSFSTHFGYSPNTEDEIKSRLLAQGSSLDDVLLIRDTGDRLVAYCWTQTRENSGSSFGRIGMTGVLPDVQGHGLGRAVAEAGFNHLVEQGVDLIELDVDSTNAPAIRIYSSLGFVTVSTVLWWEKTL
jgi:mycothiol synthase